MRIYRKVPRGGVSPSSEASCGSRWCRPQGAPSSPPPTSCGLSPGFGNWHTIHTRMSRWSKRGRAGLGVRASPEGAGRAAEAGDGWIADVEPVSSSPAVSSDGWCRSPVPSGRRRRALQGRRRSTRVLETRLDHRRLPEAGASALATPVAGQSHRVFDAYKMRRFSFMLTFVRACFGASAADQCPSDHFQRQRLFRALEDRKHAGVGEVAACVGLFGVAHAAVDLHRLAGDPFGGAAGE